MPYKLSNRHNIQLTLIFIFSTWLTDKAFAQDPGYTRPPLTKKWEEYRDQVKKDSSKKMIELKSLVPGIIYDLRYATVNNFMRRLMYPEGTSSTYLRSPAAHALLQIQQELQQQGMGLKIYDAYRPYAVTVRFWELVKDERYVANPSRGSGHNRGIAVDLTINNLKTKKELPMGTGFDNFSDTAHHTFTRLPEEVLQNRQRLKSIMEKYGFRAYADEWWHYSWPEASKYEILDIEFRKLKKEL